MILCRPSVTPSGTSAGEVPPGYACLGLVADEPEEAVPPHPHTAQQPRPLYGAAPLRDIAWEFGKLLEKKRIGISCDPEEWFRVALEMPKLRLVPLTPTLSYRSTTLPQPFHGDPADQIIVATAREENATVLTKDNLIRQYKHVRTLW